MSYGKLFVSGLFLFIFLLPVAAEAQESIDEIQTQYQGPHIEVNVAARQLKLFDYGDKLIKTYQIAVGQGRFPTPLGPRKMRKIVWNPWWIPPKSYWARNDKPTPPGPRNPLGPIKMKLGGGIMFHGTNKPKSVGNAASHGCMRMYSEQAMELGWYLQQRLTEQRDESLREKYAKNPRKSFHVHLSPEKQVPINIVYDVTELKGDQLHVYRDVYWKAGNKAKKVDQLLEAEGFKLKHIDRERIAAAIKESKNKKDIQIDMAELITNSRAKRKFLAKHGRKSQADKVAQSEELMDNPAYYNSLIER